MPSVDFSLELSREELLRFYAGVSRWLVVEADDGRLVEFSLDRLRPFVTCSGVQGRFRLYYDDSGRFERLDRLER